MRIISGKYKGRRLVAFKADHIRPTTDRVKESIFNILQGHWEGAVVLDLFSGTGNLGIEAMSRDAGHVTFVEMNPKSLSVISENLKMIGLSKEVSIYKKDVFKFLNSYDGKAFDIILIDPPFTDKISDEVMQTLSQSKVHGDSTWTVIESSAHEKVADSYGELVCVDRRDFGDKMVSFFQRKQGE